MDGKRLRVGRGLVAAASSLLLIGAMTGSAMAKPAEPTTLTTLVSVNEATCEFTVRYDWSGFSGKRLLAEILLYERENGVDRYFIGHDLFIVEGRQGTFTYTLGGFSASEEPAHAFFAGGSLWTYNNNTRMVAGSASFSDSVISDCNA